MKPIYTINKYYFDDIDTPEKAYFLGILWSDGHNNTKKGEIILTQSNDNHNILYDLQQQIESNCPIKIRNYTYQKTTRYDLTIYNRYISNTLESYGMIRNKTHEITFPKIPETYYNSFILGYFDGDGCISKFIPNYNNHIITFTGNELLIRKIKNIIDDKFCVAGFIPPKRKENKGTIALSYSGNRSVETILNWMYADCKIKNHKKFNKFLELIETNKNTDSKKLQTQLLNEIQEQETINSKLQKIKTKKELDEMIVFDILCGYSIRQIRFKYKRNSEYIRNIISINNIDYGIRKRMFAKQPKDF